MKEDESNYESKLYIKVLIHKINMINPCFKKKKEKENVDKRTDD